MPKKGTDGNGNFEYEVLTDKLIKSPFDHKEYKIIRLPNHVTCTLISNMAKKHHNMHMMQRSDSKPKAEDFNREYPDFRNDNVDQVRIETEGINDYKDVFENLSRNFDEHKELEEPATVIITFESGQLQDPYEFQGLAHLLEHSVFLSSTNYPKKGGIFLLPNTDVNATTEDEGTTYELQSRLEDFPQSVKYLVDLLINPKLSEAEIVHELWAVHGEYLIRRNKMSLKISALLNSFSNPGHPCSKFDCGNKASLLKNDLGNVIQEWKRHTYFGQNMSIVVSAPMPMRNLVQFAIEHFSHFPSALDNQIPATPLPTENLKSHYGPPYAGSNRFNSINVISPVSRYTKELLITWPLPPEFWKNFDSKPIDFVSYLISHLPNNRLSDILKNRRYAIDSVVWPTWNNNTFGSYFSINVILTNEGLQNYETVIKEIFSYLKGLRNFIPNSAQLFEEKRQAELSHFHYVDSHRTTHENYYHHNWTVPLKKMNTFNKLTTGFNLSEIIKVVDHLTNPELACIVILAKNGLGETQTNTPGNYYEAKYSSLSISNELLQLWKNTQPCPIDLSPDTQISRFGIDCHLTCPNDYKNPSINETEWTLEIDKKVIIKHLVVPGVEHHLQHIMPFSQYIIGLSSDELYHETPQGTACLITWTVILNEMLQNLQSSNYNNLANFGFGLGYGALVFSLRGISFKLVDIFERVIQTIGNFENLLNPLEFNNVKSYLVSHLDPLQFDGPIYLRDIQNTVLLDRYIPVGEILKALIALTYPEFVNFTRSFKSQMHIDGEIIGAISDDHRVKMYEVIRSLQFEPLKLEKPDYKAKEVPIGDRCVRIKNQDPDDQNSYISNFYFVGNENQEQVGGLNIWRLKKEGQDVFETIMKKMQGDSFIQLRTHEQLGYDVHSILDDNFSAIGISINVITPTDRFSTDYVDERIDVYLQDFYKREIENKTNTEIESTFAKYLLPGSPSMRKISFQLSGRPSDDSKQKRSTILRDKIDRNNNNFSSKCNSSDNNNNSINNNSMGDFRFGFSNNFAQNLGPFGGGSINGFGQNSGVFAGGSVNNTNGFGQNSCTFGGGTSNNTNVFAGSNFGQNSGPFSGGSTNSNGGFSGNSFTQSGQIESHDFGEEYQFDFELPTENIKHSINSYFITRIKEFKRSMPNCPNLNKPEKFTNNIYQV